MKGDIRKGAKWREENEGEKDKADEIRLHVRRRRKGKRRERRKGGERGGWRYITRGGK